MINKIQVDFLQNDIDYRIYFKVSDSETRKSLFISII